jgi:hypothetical protein
MAQQIIGDLCRILENTVVVKLEWIRINLPLVPNDTVNTRGQEMAVLELFAIPSAQGALTYLGH